MKFAAAYLRQKRRALIFYFSAFAVFAVSFALYHLPLRAVIYPALLCGLISAIYAAADMRRAYMRHVRLSKIRGLSDGLPDCLPPADSIESADYRQIIDLLCAEQRSRETHMTSRYRDMIDYYTMWAHQIKTPIAAMRLQLASGDSALSRTLSSELLRIEQYVEMVLAYLRLDSSSTDYVIREFDLDPVVRQCIRRFSGEFITRKLKLEYTPVNFSVVSDEKWLAFVVEQLLSNALKYTPEGSIAIYPEKPATLAIRDTGIGIAPEDLPRIFENGFTGLNGRSDKKASGLGLHMCRRICGKLGHDISVESAPDRGTLVRINLAQSRIEAE
jgi:two-component system sensor histidine kinase BraS/BceS